MAISTPFCLRPVHVLAILYLPLYGVCTRFSTARQHYLRGDADSIFPVARCCTDSAFPRANVVCGVVFASSLVCTMFLLRDSWVCEEQLAVILLWKGGMCCLRFLQQDSKHAARRKLHACRLLCKRFCCSYEFTEKVSLIGRISAESVACV